MEYYIALGSNLGDRKQNLELAVDGLRKIATLEGLSAIYETRPHGITDQAHFFNMVCRIQSALRPFRLLRYLKTLECALGRTRSRRWGPRLIDVDIIDWSGPVLEDQLLSIPHPRMHERGFVLKPLAEIAADYKSRSEIPISEMLKKCRDVTSDLNKITGFIK